MSNKVPVLQICHGYNAPFEMIADFYAQLFPPEHFALTTIFLKGSGKEMMPNISAGKALFWDLSSSDLKGMKIGLTRRFQQLIQENDFKIILAHRNKSIFLMCAAVGKNEKRILIGVAHAYDVFKRISRKWLAWRNRKRLNLIGVSNDIRDNIAKDVSKLGLKNIFSLPNCLDAEAFRSNLLNKQEAREKLGLNQNAYVIGSSGRLHSDKDFPTLLHAFAKAKAELGENALLLIMGEGKLENDLKKLSEKLNILEQVIFSGKVDEGYRCFKAFDQFVLSSAVESFGMVLIEAICAEVPVISSATGGAYQVLSLKENLFPLGDSNKCAELILRQKCKKPETLHTDCSKEISHTINNFSIKALKRQFWAFPFTKNLKNNPSF